MPLDNVHELGKVVTAADPLTRQQRAGCDAGDKNSAPTTIPVRSFLKFIFLVLSLS
jgi:hypothetical protein